MVLYKSFESSILCTRYEIYAEVIPLSQDREQQEQKSYLVDSSVLRICYVEKKSLKNILFF